MFIYGKPNVNWVSCLRPRPAAATHCIHGVIAGGKDHICSIWSLYYVVHFLAPIGMTVIARATSPRRARLSGSRAAPPSESASLLQVAVQVKKSRAHLAGRLAGQGLDGPVTRARDNPDNRRGDDDDAGRRLAASSPDSALRCAETGLEAKEEDKQDRRHRIGGGRPAEAAAGCR